MPVGRRLLLLMGLVVKTVGRRSPQDRGRHRAPGPVAGGVVRGELRVRASRGGAGSGRDRHPAPRGSGGALLSRVLPRVSLYAAAVPDRAASGDGADAERAARDAAAGVEEDLGWLLDRLRRAWPSTRIILRTDSGFCREAILATCESREGVDYVMGGAMSESG